MRIMQKKIQKKNRAVQDQKEEMMKVEKQGNKRG